MVQIIAEKGGWRLNVWLEGKIQRTAWALTSRQALMIAREFAEYYGDRYEPLPIEKPNDFPI